MKARLIISDAAGIAEVCEFEFKSWQDLARWLRRMAYSYFKTKD